MESDCKHGVNRPIVNMELINHFLSFSSPKEFLVICFCVSDYVKLILDRSYFDFVTFQNFNNALVG